MFQKSKNCLSHLPRWDIFNPDTEASLIQGNCVNRKQRLPEQLGLVATNSTTLPSEQGAIPSFLTLVLNASVTSIPQAPHRLIAVFRQSHHWNIFLESSALNFPVTNLWLVAPVWELNEQIVHLLFKHLTYFKFSLDHANYHRASQPGYRFENHFFGLLKTEMQSYCLSCSRT